MSSSYVAEAATALLERRAAEGWLIKVIGVEEDKDQILFALPIILTNVSYYLIPLVSVMLAGHLGELELAGSNLADSWAGVTGYALVGQLPNHMSALKILVGQLNRQFWAVVSP